jgi:predicted enzyme related to lactoylglutathione lyase
VDLAARDRDDAARFYGALFGWQRDPLPEGAGAPYAIWRLRGKAVGGMNQLSPEMQAAGVPPCWNLYVRVDDCAATLARVAGLGGAVAMPAMDAAGSGWFGFLTDPTGATLGLWQPTGFAGAELRDEPGSLCWLELNTTDPARAQAFYGALLGWSFQDMGVGGKPYAIIQAGSTGVGGMMQIQPEWGDVPSHWLPYFGAEDCDDMAAATRASGGRVVTGPMDISPEHGRFVILADGQGAVFACHQPAATGAAAAPPAATPARKRAAKPPAKRRAPAKRAAGKAATKKSAKKSVRKSAKRPAKRKATKPKGSKRGGKRR